MKLNWRVFNSASRVARKFSLDLALKRLIRPRGSLTVLTYHRVAELDDYSHLDPALLSATPAGFSQQLDYLQTQYNFINAAQLLAAARGEKPLPDHPMLITFDDGYADFEKNAWPALKSRSIPACLFVSTHNVENRVGFWWDQLHLLLKQMGERQLHVPELSSHPMPASTHATKKRLKIWLKSLHPDLVQEWIDNQSDTASVSRRECSLLDWTALNRLANEGLTICPHTQTHPIITQLPSSDVKQEINGSFSDLIANIGQPLPLFAYPSGYVDQRTRDLCEESPTEIAFTTRFGANRLCKADPLLLRRINVSLDSEPAALAMQATVARLLC